MPLSSRIPLVAALLSLAACKSDSKPEASASKTTEAAAQPATPTAKAPPPEEATDDEATALAVKPKARVTIDDLGLSLEVPEGTTVTPEDDADAAKRRANLKQGKFMVNVFAVDEFSTPSFAKANEVYESDKLVAWIRSEETPTGWITFKEVVSSVHKANRFEVSVRTEVRGKKWDCSISAPSKPLAELALAACQTLAADGEPAAKTVAAAAAAATAAPSKPAAKAHAKPAAKAEKPQVQGGLTKDVIQRIVRANFGKLRTCYERELLKNPTLSVRLTTAFEIGTSGKVSAANTTGGDAPLNGCVAAVFKGMQFPAPPAGSVRASYPIVFEPGA